MVVSSLFGQHYSQKTPDHLLEDEDEQRLEEFYKFLYFHAYTFSTRLVI